MQNNSNFWSRIAKVGLMQCCNRDAFTIEQAHKHKNPLQHKGDREYKGMKNL